MDSLSPRRFGVEIELSRRFTCVNNHDRTVNKSWTRLGYMIQNLIEGDRISPGWKIKTDTSCGGEVVSPPLFGPDGMREVTLICSKIRKIAQDYYPPAVDGECGLHIHIDAADMNAPQLGNLFSIVHMAEPIIFSMYPNRNFEYCAPISVNMRQARRVRDWFDVRDVWYRPSNNLRTGKNYQESFINSTNAGDNYDGTRYHGFNIHCFWKFNTVEFRYGSGTIDPLHIKAYYEMCLSMVNTAMSTKKISIPDSIKNMKYDRLIDYYKSSYRFRKITKRLAKTCNFSRSTIKLITSLVSENNPELLDKEQKPTGKVIVIDNSNRANYYYRVEGVLYNWQGTKVTRPRKKPIIECRILTKVNRSAAIEPTISGFIFAITIGIKLSKETEIADFNLQNFDDIVATADNNPVMITATPGNAWQTITFDGATTGGIIADGAGADANIIYDGNVNVGDQPF